MAEKRIDWEKAARLSMHPVRLRVLEAFHSKEVWSPVELSKELEVKLSNMSYQIRVLKQEGWLTLEKTRPVRGSVEHFYRLAD